MTTKIKILGLLLCFAACDAPPKEASVRVGAFIDPNVTRAAVFQRFYEKFKDAAVSDNLTEMLSLCKFPLETGEDMTTFAENYKNYFTPRAVYRIGGSQDYDWDQPDKDLRSYVVNEGLGVTFYARNIDNQYKIVAIETN